MKLVPQICFMTGLTDLQRSDFRVMKDINQFTKLTPAARETQIRKFAENVASELLYVVAYIRCWAF